jgi:malate permease and related proteins
MMGVGAFARRVKLLPPEADAGLMRLAVNVLFPCLILVRLVGNEQVRDPARVLGAAALGFGLVACGITIAYVLAPLLGLRVGQGRRTFGMSVGIQNYGFVAIPVITSLFTGPAILGVMFTFTLGVELAVWTLGVGVLTGMAKAPWRAALNVPVISILIALTLNFAGLDNVMPAVILKTLEQLGSCSVPLSVVLIGASIYDLWGREKMQWNVALAAPVLRLLVIPCLFMAAARWLPITDDLKRVLLVQGSMPAAVFGIVLARLHGGHLATAVQVILATTLVSLVTMPFVLSWGLQWLGLGGVDVPQIQGGPQMACLGICGPP